MAAPASSRPTGAFEWVVTFMRSKYEYSNFDQKSSGRCGFVPAPKLFVVLACYGVLLRRKNISKTMNRQSPHDHASMSIIKTSRD